ncbi:ABC transporter substrate-binding protein [Segetibacter koreensis]|uniref:ABC transporter substrate-binding protein n=1 Tax=Segetibacter koreensis TaxID=398037 RepID=UPI00035EF602|nr:ABC transporter substrate-binding protein [Segetibacter koreensis]
MGSYNVLYKLIIVSFFLVSCASKSKSDKQVFVYNQVEGIATLDPAFTKNQATIWLAHQLYNTLVETDSDLNIVPSLAKSWEISDDRLLYTFHLHNDVYFHDNQVFANGKGRRMTATDIVYSLSRIIDKSTASSGAWIFNNRVKSNGFSALNDSTFQLQLIRPFHPILGILSMQYCSIVPREVVEKYGKDFRSHPCGTGPFQFHFWEEGQALVLYKNPHYFEKDEQGKQLPYLDALKISFLDSRSTEFLAFQQGQLSFVNDIDPSFKDEVLTKNGDLRKEWKEKIILHKHPYLNTEYLGILVDEQNNLVKNSPLRIKAIRQAINCSVNRNKLMMYLRNSIGTPATAGIVPAGLPSKNAEMVKGYAYDPAKARQLLKDAGFENGKGLPVITLLTIPIYADIGSFVAKQLEETGIKVQVEVVQKSLLLEQTAKSEALFFRGSWIADYPDAENYMAMFYSKNPAPPNYTRYKNPAFDILYEKALQENNDSDRYALYREMDQMVIKDAPVVPLFYDMAIHLVSKNVHNFKPNALNLLELRRVTIDNEK